ncbi:hypothetical protein HPC49_21100 [Pyxidicoccus fallax]|uniref:Uncharacterized protein n=1 Tax=Pyxidicoccus fallax TaxID=394095 RepID=A0A848LA84_9BACT|nr:hypothetical protein [Pyxidicoccus fallax]NMO15406.1 hypothetical protein [Pyxidicoccus fallax]NPC80712.1 hypothetical protein [Pyxidicoccus fallax]
MWIETIIMPREDSEPYVPSPQRDRSRFVKSSAEESRALRDAVLRFLSAHQLVDAVKWMSEPGFLPIITIHCTELALMKLRDAAEFVVGCAAPVETYPALVSPQPTVAPAVLLPAMPVFEPRL